jgi:hypothetical protein
MRKGKGTGTKAKKPRAGGKGGKNIIDSVKDIVIPDADSTKEDIYDDKKEKIITDAASGDIMEIIKKYWWVMAIAVALIAAFIIFGGGKKVKS